jgi:hypothetical protein
MSFRQSPSSAARSISYSHLRSLFSILDLLCVSHPLLEGQDYFFDFKGWKQWVIKFTPENKRGGK